MRIYVNAGHGVNPSGGYDSGAVGPTGLREADVNASIAQRVVAYLRAAGHHVGEDFTTRRSWCAARAASKTFKAEALVSIHCNSVANRTAKGLETLYRLSPGRPLAEYIQAELLIGVRKGSTPYNVLDRKIKHRPTIGVLNTPWCPSCLVEYLFISNPIEEQMLRLPEWTNRAGWCIAQGIIRWGARRR